MSPLDVVNEGTTHDWSIALTDQDGAALTPTKATLRIDDEYSGTIIRAATDISTLGSTMVVTVTSAETAMVNVYADFEVRILTIELEYGVPTRKCKEEHRYAVKNLRKVT